MHDPEPYVQGALDYLRDHLPDTLAEIDAEHDDFELPVPRNDSYTFGVVQTPTVYPIIDAGSPDWEMTDFDINTLASEFSFSIIVRARLRDTDYDRLCRSVYRFGGAMVGLLAQRGALPDHAEVTAARGGFRINPETEDREELVGTVVLGLNVEHAVDIPIPTT